MAWTSPRDWIVGEIVTAAQLNTQLRDNLLQLSRIETGTYTGDGATGRLITVGFDPMFVIVTGNSGGSPYSLSPVAGSPFGFAFNGTGGGSLESTAQKVPLPATGGFTVSVSATPDATDTNFSGQGYFWFAVGKGS